MFNNFCCVLSAFALLVVKKQCLLLRACRDLHNNMLCVAGRRQLFLQSLPYDGVKGFGVTE